MKTTPYFEETRNRLDRSYIRMVWIQQVIDSPTRERTQNDGRILRWAKIE